MAAHRMLSCVPGTSGTESRNLSKQVLKFSMWCMVGASICCLPLNSGGRLLYSRGPLRNRLEFLALLIQVVIPLLTGTSFVWNTCNPQVLG